MHVLQVVQDHFSIYFGHVLDRCFGLILLEWGTGYYHCFVTISYYRKLCVKMKITSLVQLKALCVYTFVYSVVYCP